MIVYLACAIDQMKDVEAIHRQSSVMADLRNKMAGWGHSVYVPQRAWKYSKSGTMEDLVRLDEINRYALSKSDVLVAFLPADVASIGVPTEIEIHTRFGRPAIVIGAAESIVLDANRHVRRIRSPDWPTIMSALQGELTEAQDHWPVDEGVGLKIAMDAVLAKPHRIEPYAGNDNLDSLQYALQSWGAMPPTYTGATGANQSPSPARDLSYKVTDTDQDWSVGSLERTFADDAGLDLVTAQDVTMNIGQWIKIPCGVAVGLPSDVFGWVVARSSTFEKWGIIVLPGIIDPGYRGELGVSALMIGTGGTLGDDRYIPAGTRLAQLLIMPNLARQFKPRQVDDFMYKDHVRGLNGWGSSGS